MRHLLAIALLVSACAIGPTTAIATLPPPRGEPVMVNVGPGEVRITTVSGKAVQGQRYHFEAMTHCGLRANTFDFDGSFWTVVGQGDDGNGNPPQGIGNPVDDGVIQMIGLNQAVWTSQSGVRVNLERGPSEAQVFLCD
jgi:hypothetical protein